MLSAGALVSWPSLNGRAAFIAVAIERDSPSASLDLRSHVSEPWLGVYARRASATVTACWLDDAKLEFVPQ